MASDPINEPTPVEPGNLMDAGERWWLGLYLFLAMTLFLYLLGKFWPYEFGPGTLSKQPNEMLFGFLEVKTSGEVRMLVLVLCAGALGAMIHAVQSFVDFHGNQRLARSWLPWYLMRPYVGALLALVFYLLIRGGLVTGGLNGGSEQSAVSVVGLLGASALVGMFSDLASLKLKEIFTTIFATALKTQRSDALATKGTKPEIKGLHPDKLDAGAANLKVTVEGSNFDKESKVLVGDKERTTKYVSNQELTVQLEAQDAAAKGELKIVVRNPAAAGGESDSRILPVS